MGAVFFLIRFFEYFFLNFVALRLMCLLSFSCVVQMVNQMADNPALMESMIAQNPALQQALQVRFPVYLCLSQCLNTCRRDKSSRREMKSNVCDTRAGAC